jgi:streptogramin lyase
MRIFSFFGLSLVLLPATAQAATISVVGPGGKPLPTVMVTERMAAPVSYDTSDNGYPAPGFVQERLPDVTGFTGADGRVALPTRAGERSLRLRKWGYQDLLTTVTPAQPAVTFALAPETDATMLAFAKPANVWLGALDLGRAEDKQHFQMQCGFCHQLGSPLVRRDRPAQEWGDVIHRMIRYGSRLPTDLQKALPEKLSAEFARLNANPAALAEPRPWDASLAGTLITEWPVGDSFSQEHDMLIHPNGNVYVADNIQDRVWEVNPKTHAVAVYKIPHREGEQPGGLIAGRLREFPKHDSTSNAHSLAASPVDGHIFITPSAQRRLVEFDPAAKTFTLHEMQSGFYPHTIRTDKEDRVWFTLALSNQIARFDRKTQTFKLYDLPTRSFKERVVVWLMPFLFKLINWGVPLPNLLAIDRLASGTPMPYGIDITPDGKVWFARLHTREIGCLDPRTDAITMVATPFLGPRRLRADAHGNLWITSYAESLVARYAPATGQFTLYDLPVLPKGSDTPYALNVDRKRDVVWVNGNQSDSLYALDVSSGAWRVIPLPKRTTFTRDIEVEEDGSVYTSNSNFPSWQVEDGQPTLIHVSAK